MANEVLYEVKGRIALITLNRPERMNAISMALREQLRDAFLRFEADAALRVAILTGAGERAFSAGNDLKWTATNETTRWPASGFGGLTARTDLLKPLIAAVNGVALGVQTVPIPVLGDNVHVSKPVIAAVNGFALAGGWLLAQMCDLCVATEHAEFGITEGKVGRGMPWAAPLMHMVPRRIALELLLTGRRISARRAYEIGFVNAVVPAARLIQEATALADEIVACAPLTVAAAKEMVYLSGEMGVSAGLRAGHHIFDRVYRSEDALEGPRAFKEKRKPDWKGR